VTNIKNIADLIKSKKKITYAIVDPGISAGLRIESARVRKNGELRFKNILTKHVNASNAGYGARPVLINEFMKISEFTSVDFYIFEKQFKMNVSDVASEIKGAIFYHREAELNRVKKRKHVKVDDAGYVIYELASSFRNQAYSEFITNSKLIKLKAKAGSKKGALIKEKSIYCAKKICEYYGEEDHLAELDKKDDVADVICMSYSIRAFITKHLED
jgi:hypothetical protein